MRIFELLAVFGRRSAFDRLARMFTPSGLLLGLQAHATDRGPARRQAPPHSHYPRSRRYHEPHRPRSPSPDATLLVGRSNTVLSIVQQLGGARPKPLTHLAFSDLWRTDATAR